MSSDSERRTNTVFNAINKPPTFFGIHRMYAIICFLFGMVLYVLLGSAIVAFILSSAVILAIRKATRNDLDAIPVYFAASALPATYDGCRFSRIEVNKI